MTTVVYRDGVLAFDSKCTDGDMYLGSVYKGRQTKKLIMAGCGNVDEVMAVFDWLEAGGTEVLKKDFGLHEREVEATVITVDKMGNVTLYESRLYPIQIDSLWYALGSGSAIATGALEMGASARKAVAVATKHDLGSGGSVRWFSCEDLSKKSKKLAKKRAKRKR